MFHIRIKIKRKQAPLEMLEVQEIHSETNLVSPQKWITGAGSSAQSDDPENTGKGEPSMRWFWDYVKLREKEEEIKKILDWAKTLTNNSDGANNNNNNNSPNTGAEPGNSQH